MTISQSFIYLVLCLNVISKVLTFLVVVLVNDVYYRLYNQCITDCQYHITLVIKTGDLSQIVLIIID